MKYTNLPQKFAVAVTPENRDALTKWRDVKRWDATWGFLLSYCAGAIGYHVDSLTNYQKYELISWEQFEENVLKIKPKLQAYDIY